MKRLIYAVWDRTANDLAGQNMLYMFPHDAPAVRMFQDVTNQQGTIVNAHPQEFDLICLGEITQNDDQKLPYILQGTRVVVTGAALHAATQQQQPEERR